MKTNKINVVLSLNKTVVASYSDSDRIAGAAQTGQPTSPFNCLGSNNTGPKPSTRCNPETKTFGGTLGTTVGAWSAYSGCC